MCTYTIPQPPYMYIPELTQLQSFIMIHDPLKVASFPARGGGEPRNEAFLMESV